MAMWITREVTHNKNVTGVGNGEGAVNNLDKIFVVDCVPKVLGALHNRRLRKLEHFVEIAAYKAHALAFYTTRMGASFELVLIDKLSKGDCHGLNQNYTTNNCQRG